MIAVKLGDTRCDWNSQEAKILILIVLVVMLAEYQVRRIKICLKNHYHPFFVLSGQRYVPHSCYFKGVPLTDDKSVLWLLDPSLEHQNDGGLRVLVIEELIIIVSERGQVGCGPTDHEPVVNLRSPQYLIGDLVVW